MNQTVWYEQIDRGLKNYISGNILLANSSGTLVPVPVRIRKADEDFKVEDYPMITISHINVGRRDENRYNAFDCKVVRDLEHNTAAVDPPAIPYTLKYQIDLWATLHSDMNALSSQWLYKFGRAFNLPVIDSGGTERTTLCQWSGDAALLENKLSGGDRVFHTPMTYDVWAELDTPLITLDEVYIVKEIAVDARDSLNNKQ